MTSRIEFLCCITSCISFSTGTEILWGHGSSCALFATSLNPVQGLLTFGEQRLRMVVLLSLQGIRCRFSQSRSLFIYYLFISSYAVPAGEAMQGFYLMFSSFDLIHVAVLLGSGQVGKNSTPSFLTLPSPVTQYNTSYRVGGSVGGVSGQGVGLERDIAPCVAT